MAKITDVVGYSFDADTYCVDCTRKHFNLMVKAWENHPAEVDENGLPYILVDGESNPVRAMFPTEEFDYQANCASCFEELDCVNLGEVLADCFV